MRITLVCVGKVKESWLREGIAEYSKRLSSSIQLTIREVAEEAAPQTLSDKEKQQLLLREGERILKALPADSYCCALSIDGKTYSSEALADKLSDLGLHGRSSVTFIIGSSLGLGTNILTNADERISLGPLTYPHQLCRLILLEQLYRANSIQQGTPYHK